jgi:catechol 1,2-dioxygenase
LLAGCDFTPSDMLGPYHAEDAPFRVVLCPPEQVGTRMFISGRVLGSDCVSPVPGAIVDVWQADNTGCYSIFQQCGAADPFNLRGQMLTDANGEYAYETILPGYYTGRPRHVHYIVAPPQGSSLTTQLYFQNDPQSAGQPAALRIPLEEVDGQLFGVFDVNLNYDVPADTDPDHSLPTVARLHPNYPNPFRDRTTIRYQLRLESAVVLEVFRPDGRIVRRLVSERQGPGYYTTEWDGRDDGRRAAPAGMYLYRLRAGEVSEVRKMTRLSAGGA